MNRHRRLVAGRDTRKSALVLGLRIKVCSFFKDFFSGRDIRYAHVSTPMTAYWRVFDLEFARRGNVENPDSSTLTVCDPDIFFYIGRAQKIKAHGTSTSILPHGHEKFGARVAFCWDPVSQLA